MIYATGCLGDERGEKGARERESGEGTQSMKRFSTRSRVCSISRGDLEKEYFTAEKCVCLSLCVCVCVCVWKHVM